MQDNLIIANNISVHFDRLIAIENISFRIPKGSFLTIIGPNGAGKSTLIKLIIGLQKPDSGSITIGGEAPGKKSAASLGYVPQFKNMNRHFPAIAEELVYSGLNGKWPWALKKGQQKRVHEAMKTVKVEELAKQPIKQLSGGELQRVCLARSIVNYPDIIVLDEPVTGIDMVGEADMYSLLESYQRIHQATIIMITHDWHAAQHHSSHVLLMNKKKIAFGKPAEVLTDLNLRSAFGHTGHEHPKLQMGGGND